MRSRQVTRGHENCATPGHLFVRVGTKEVPGDDVSRNAGASDGGFRCRLDEFKKYQCHPIEFKKYPGHPVTCCYSSELFLTHSLTHSLTHCKK